MLTSSIIDASNSARLHKSLQQRSELAGSVEVLRVPLHADAKPARRILDGFDHAVRRRGRRDESFAKLLRCLMMAAVDLAALGVAPGLASQPRHARPFL